MQPIVVYTNPAAAALWESGLVFPLIVSLAAFGICVAVGTALVTRLVPRSAGRNAQEVGVWAVFIASAVVAWKVLTTMGGPL